MHNFLRCTMSFRIIHLLWILHENICSCVVLSWKEQLTKRARWLKNIHPIYICTLSTNWPFRNLGRKKILKIFLYCLWKKGLVKQGVRIPLICHFRDFQAQQSKALPRQFRATVFRLLSKMVREKLRILLNSKIQAVHLRVLVRTDGMDWPSCRPLKSSPGLLDQSLKGIWKGMRGFSGTSLWPWSANTRNNFAHEQSTVPGWHRPPRSDCWALGEDRVAAGSVLGQQRQLWWLSTVQNLPGTPLQISSQETSLNLPSSSFILQRQWFFFNQLLLGCF